jgi:hypothetical protein
MHVDPECKKRQSSQQCHLALLELTSLKAARKTLVKLTPGNENDAEYDGHDGGDHVVGDGTTSYLAGEAEVEASHGHDERGYDERNDDALEHLKKEGADEFHVHGLEGKVVIHYYTPGVNFINVF